MLAIWSFVLSFSFYLPYLYHARRLLGLSRAGGNGDAWQTSVPVSAVVSGCGDDVKLWRDDSEIRVE